MTDNYGVEEFLRENQENAKPFNKEEFAASKKAERDALHDMRRGAIEHTFSCGNAFLAYLDAQSRHPMRSLGNTLLIETQKPGATDVRSYDAWNDVGRSVRKGKNGIRIFRREESNDNEYYNVEHVFDIAQTAGRSITGNLEQPTPEALIRALTTSSAFKCIPDSTLSVPAQFDRKSWTVRIGPIQDLTASFHAIARELGHANIAKRESGDSYDRSRFDFYANCAGYIVAKRYFPVSMDGMSLDAAIKKVEPLSQEIVLGLIQRTEASICRSMDRALQPDKQKERDNLIPQL